MSIIKRGADLVYTFRFIRMLVTDWKDWDAYKEGLIDEKGDRIKSVPVKTSKQKAAYTPFIRLAANTKRLLSKVPGGGTKLGSFAAGLLLIKEHLGVDDERLNSILQEHGLDSLDLLAEENEWFVLEDRQLSPGLYRINCHTVIKESFEPIVNPKDRIRVLDDSYPVGDVFGIDVYEAVHVNTNKKIYVTSKDIYR